MALVQNPILPGFHPDPCIVRHDGWYYVVTSTFEWWPGVQINRSRDLVTWELLGYALTRRSQLDLRGVPDSGGVWAPALSFSDRRFWLVYSDVKAFAGPAKDVRNFLVTSDTIEGPWSEPVYLNRSGFDPSLFHDDDGRKWLVNQLWKPSLGPDAFDGIVLQEYSSSQQCLIGEPQKIFQGSSLGTTEGPHLYRKDGFYYLVTAEGGTGWKHAVAVARARNLLGPYEISPHHPLLTSALDPDGPLQKSGHASFVCDENGRWFMAHLCSRVVPGTRRCTLGRETAVQPIEWPAGDWPRMLGGGSTPLEKFETNASSDDRPYFDRFNDDFHGRVLAPHWNTLREPASSSWLSLDERPGFLRLNGRHSIQSLFEHSLVGCRVAHHRCDIRTLLEYRPHSPCQRAGLALYYNTANFYYLNVSGETGGALVINVLVCDNGRYREDPADAMHVASGVCFELQARLRDASLTFSCVIDGGEPRIIGGDFDATILSDDYPLDSGVGWAFTGVFAALCTQDSTHRPVPADFDWFHYEAVRGEPAK